jgi:Short C-terminal domain
VAILRRRPLLRAAAISAGAYSAARKRRARRRLEELVELHASGDLSEKEFARRKAAALAEEEA